MHPGWPWAENGEVSEKDVSSLCFLHCFNSYIIVTIVSVIKKRQLLPSHPWVVDLDKILVHIKPFIVL